MASASQIIGGLFVSVVCFTFLTLAMYPKKDGETRFKIQFLEDVSDKHWSWFILFNVIGLSVGAFIWIGTIAFYYCLTPQAIVIHESVLRHSRQMRWSDVASVEASCGHGRGGSFGGLTVLLNDGMRVWVPLGRGEAQDVQRYSAIASALGGQSFGFTGENIVRADQCPPAIVRMFAGPL